jgi:hypothetical protein
MITFSPLKTRRLNITLHEISAGDAIALCAMRSDMQEASTTALLQGIITPDPAPRASQVVNPRAMTVCERAMITAHYIAHVNGESHDFYVGEQGRFSNYIRDGADYPQERVDVCELGGDFWTARPILGADAEAIERLIVGGRLASSGRAVWRVAAMAATMSRRGESVPNPLEVSDSEFDDWIESRVRVFMGFPERDFINLLMEFIEAQQKLDHLLILHIGTDGLVFLPNEGGAGLPPARFPYRSAIDERTEDIFGKA